MTTSTVQELAGPSNRTCPLALSSLFSDAVPADPARGLTVPVTGQERTIRLFERKRVSGIARRFRAISPPTRYYSAPTMRSRKRSAPAPRRRGAKTRTTRTAAASAQAARARDTGASSGLAPGMQTVNTYLAVANVNASMDFLERAFAFTRGVVLSDTDGQVRYAEMRHGDSVIMLVRRGDAA